MGVKRFLKETKLYYAWNIKNNSLSPVQCDSEFKTTFPPTNQLNWLNHSSIDPFELKLPAKFNKRSVVVECSNGQKISIVWIAYRQAVVIIENNDYGDLLNVCFEHELLIQIKMLWQMWTRKES